MLLSILDLQLQAGQAKYDRREIAAYVFLNDKCLDTINLGSPTVPDLQQSSQSPNLNRAPKVKIPLLDTRKRLHILVKRLEEGTTSRTDLITKQKKNYQSFGSVTFNLAKLAQATSFKG